MYAKEDKERILAEFHASGLTPNRFAALPSSPAACSIRAWLKEEGAGLLDVPVIEVRGRAERPKHRRYDERTKREAVRLYRKGMRACDVARRLDLSCAQVVRVWARRAAPGAPRGTMPGKEAIAMDAGERAELERLRAECDELKMTQRVLLELMRDPKAGSPERLSNKQKTALGERLRRDFGYSQKQVVTYFGMPRSTYAYDLKAISRDTARAREVGASVRRAFEESGRVYGYRRVRALMASWDEPFVASEREVRDAMREGGMAPRRTRRRRRYSSYEGETDERPANVPLREDGTHDFAASSPGEMVVTDVTEFAVGRAKVYLSPIVDCFDGLPAAWSVSTRPDSELCDSSLAKYLAQGAARPGTVCHTDGGACYRSSSWKRLCAENRIVRSMSRKGRSPDNARAEGFFGTLKEEFYNGRDWSRCTTSEFERQLDGYIEWYRDGRLKSFVEDGRVVYDTIMGRRRRLGYAT